MRRWEKLPDQQPYLSIDRLIALLRSRGLEIRDTERAAHYLGVIGYHRLRAYITPFLKSPIDDKIFKSDVSFNDIINLYNLDRQLRLILMGPMEKIEIALRALIIEALGDSLARGKTQDDSEAILLLSEDHFKLDSKANKELYCDIGNACIREVYRMNKNKITAPRPNFFTNSDTGKELVHKFSAYHVLHNLSFGHLSKFYRILQQNPSSNISKYFRIDTGSLHSILNSLAKLRNTCVHHEPMWFRQIMPLRFPENYLPFIYPFEAKQVKNELIRQRLYLSCAAVHILLGHISEITTWYSRLKPVIDRFPVGCQRHMGFPKDWDELSFWRTPDVRILVRPNP